MHRKYLEKNYKNLIQAHGFEYIGSWEMDLVLNKSYLSEEAYRIFGITSEQYDGTNEGFLKFVHPDDINIINNYINNPIKDHSYDMEYRIINKEGCIRNIYQIIESISDEQGNITYLYGTIQDITEKKEIRDILGQTQETINRIQRRFQVLVQESSDVFEIISPDGTIQYISPAIEKIIGAKPEERVGQKAFDYIEGKEKLNFDKMLESVLKNPEKKVRGDIVIKSLDGKDIYLTLAMSNQLEEPSIQGIVINWRDITERIQSQNEIEYIATHDEMTKLPNRVYLKNKMNHLKTESKEKDTSFALFMIDIDGLKYINDAIGYQFGDQLIIQVSERLINFLGDSILVSRYSGDQFAIIVEGLRKTEDCESIAKDIICLFLYPFKVDMYELDVSINMGISFFPEDEQDPEFLINYANIALLRSKHEGKNIYEFYSSDIGIQTYKQLVLRNDMIKAIERNQFKVYYQPQVILKSNDIIAAEALIRWEHPEWGMISPMEFIPLAEETGFIINIGKWMLREVCKNYKQWLEEGLNHIKISLNYSSIQFFEKNFVDNIKSIIDEYDLNPHFLIMEITESVLMKNAEKTIADIQRLQAFGIQVALDDFGTGFSCLAYLNSFSIDILKIDRSFIKNVLLDESSTIITRSVIDMAQQLKIKLVAEGIENWDQLSYLQELNCYTGQGFLYNRPVPISEFQKLLAKEKCFPAKKESKVKKLVDNRKYHRIRLPLMIEADMAIVDIPGQKFKVGKSKVTVKNIGSGGLCFSSDLRLPINKELVLQITIPVENKNISIYGYPIWTKDEDDGLFDYGIEFIPERNEKNDLKAIYKLCKQLYNI